MIEKRYNLEKWGSKGVWRLLRFLSLQPARSFSIVEISNSIVSSRANVYKWLKNLEELWLVKTIKTGRKKIYQIDISSALALPLYEVFCIESFQNILPQFKNGIELFLDKIDKSKVKCLILFGSVAYGLASRFSDIDLCVVLNKEEDKDDMQKIAHALFPDYKFEIHYYNDQEFRSLDDFVVFDSILNGIPILGMAYVFEVKKQLTSFPKAYLIYRLNKVKEFFKKAQKYKGEAKKYFMNLVNISLGEIASVIMLGTTVGKRTLKFGMNINKEILRLESEIAKRGDRIWLT